MFTTPRSRRNMAIAALIVFALSTIAIAFSAAADGRPAHSETGSLEITTAEATSPTSIRVEAGLVYADDQHLATGATVTATATGPGGATAGPQPLSRLDEDSSIYGGDLTVSQPGSWQVQVSSTEPTAEATTTVEIAAATTTTASPSTTVEATESTAAVPDDATTTAPAEAPETSTAAASQDADDDGGDSNVGLIALVVALLVVVVGGLSWYVVSKRGATGAGVPEGSDPESVPPSEP